MSGKKRSAEEMLKDSSHPYSEAKGSFPHLKAILEHSTLSIANYRSLAKICQTKIAALEATKQIDSCKTLDVSSLIGKEENEAEELQEIEKLESGAEKDKALKRYRGNQELRQFLKEVEIKDIHEINTKSKDKEKEWVIEFTYNGHTLRFRYYSYPYAARGWFKQDHEIFLDGAQLWSINDWEKLTASLGMENASTATFLKIIDEWWAINFKDRFYTPTWNQFASREEREEKEGKEKA